MKTKLIAILLIIGCARAGSAQTIARNDMKHFYAKLKVVDYDSRTGHQTLDCSEIIEYKFDRNNIMTMPNDSTHWFEFRGEVYNGHAGVNKVMVYSWQKDPAYNYEFYILSDMIGFESISGLLTIWEKIGEDSLRYHCGYSEGFDAGIGITEVEYVSILPDSSYLLITHTRGGDGGEAWEDYRFFKEISACDFESFYSVNFSFSDYKPEALAYYYLFDQMKHYDFTLSEIIEFSTYDVDEHDIVRKKNIDSVQVNLLDLWQMASDALK